MTTELDDQQTVDRLRAGFESARYGRDITDLRQPSRVPAFIGVGAATAVAGLVLANVSGPASSALAWSPVPEAVTSADEAAVREACTLDTTAETPGVDSGRQPTGPVPSIPTNAVPPAELPTLVSLDLRGDAGLATFADADWTVNCLVVRVGSGFERGPVVAEPTVDTTAAATLTLGWLASTTWTDGSEISMAAGTTPPGSVVIEIAVPGREVATANVSGGRFGIWWPGGLDGSGGTIRAIDAAGSELAVVALPIAGADDPTARP